MSVNSREITSLKQIKRDKYRKVLLTNNIVKQSFFT